MTEKIKQEEEVLLEKKCENKCPKCDSSSSSIEWTKTERASDNSFIKYNAVCNQCGCEFTEYHNCVYSSTEYYGIEEEKDSIENPYALYYIGNTKEELNVMKRTKKDIQKAKEISKKITEILNSLVEALVSSYKKRGTNYASKVLVKYENKIKVFEDKGVGVGDTQTDEQICNVLEKKLKEKDIPEQDAARWAESFYYKIH